MNYLSEIKKYTGWIYDRWNITEKKRFEDTVTETILIKLYREKWNLKNEKAFSKLWDIFKPNICEIVPEKEGGRKKWIRKRLKK